MVGDREPAHARRLHDRLDAITVLEAVADTTNKTAQGGWVMAEPYWSTRSTAVVIYLGNMVASDCQIDSYRTLCHQQGSQFLFGTNAAGTVRYIIRGRPTSLKIERHNRVTLALSARPDRADCFTVTRRSID